MTDKPYGPYWYSGPGPNLSDSPPQRALDLDAIRIKGRLDLSALRERYASLDDLRDRGRAFHDMHLLINTLTDTRAELDTARAAWGEASDVAVDGLLRAEERRSALADREADAARAERTEPATGEDRESVVPRS